LEQERSRVRKSVYATATSSVLVSEKASLHKVFQKSVFFGGLISSNIWSGYFGQLYSSFFIFVNYLFYC